MSDDKLSMLLDRHQLQVYRADLLPNVLGCLLGSRIAVKLHWILQQRQEMPDSIIRLGLLHPPQIA